MLGLQPRFGGTFAGSDPVGVLRINWRIIQASLRLVDYVVVHELVHLLHPHYTTAY